MNNKDCSRTSMEIMGALIFVVFLSGCFGPIKPAPQTRSEALNEFINDNQKWSVKHSYTSHKSYEKTVSKLDSQVNNCLNFDHKVVSVGRGSGPSGTWSYRATLLRTGKTTAELTVRRIDPEGLRATNDMPSGGYFHLLANIKKNKKGTADIVLYGARYGEEGFIDAIQKWSTSEYKECPIEFDD